MSHPSTMLNLLPFLLIISLLSISNARPADDVTFGLLEDSPQLPPAFIPGPLSSEFLNQEQTQDFPPLSSSDDIENLFVELPSLPDPLITNDAPPTTTTTTTTANPPFDPFFPASIDVPPIAGGEGGEDNDGVYVEIGCAEKYPVRYCCASPRDCIPSPFCSEDRYLSCCTLRTARFVRCVPPSIIMLEGPQPDQNAMNENNFEGLLPT